jgi:hypothetical protein
MDTDIPGVLLAPTPAEREKLRRAFDAAVWDAVGESVDDVRIGVERLHDRLTALQARIDKLERGALSPAAIQALAKAQAQAALSAGCECEEACHVDQP